MASNCRFAFAVHVMSVLASRPDQPFSSESLAQTVNTHPVVIRRLLLELKSAGLLHTSRGPKGGARLARPASEITLLDISRAVQDEIALFGEHPNEPNAQCFVGREIKRVLDGVAQRAREAVEEQYRSQSLADITREIG